MRSNISLFAVLLLLSACGGGRTYDYAPELGAAPPQGSLAAQSWGQPGQRAPAPAPEATQPQSQQAWAPPQDQSSETWRAADGTLRTRAGPVRQQPTPQVQQQPAYDNGAPGASYAQPGASQVAPQTPQNYAPPPSQDYPAAGASGPRGSSADIRYDEVGYAGVRGVAGGGAMEGAIVAVHRSLPPGSFIEVTSLESGKTILAMVTGSMGPGADHPVDLSAGAARLLGYSGTGAMPVRIRVATATGPDQAALRSGQPAGPRPDTPPVLLTALRKHLPGASSAVVAAPASSYSPPVHSASPRPAPVRAAPSGRYFVQVAALSNAARAQSLAQSMGGFVKPGGGLYRVQLGPFATAAQAQAARQRAAGAGYGDARVLAN